MAESNQPCVFPEPNDSTKVNSSVEYLNEFKQMKLSNGTLVEPIGMELSQLRIVRYKQFLSNHSLPLNEQLEKAYVFDLAGSLTTLVGPNNSGKTTLLKAVQLFCQAVKYGSDDYSLEKAKELLGIEDIMFNVLLQGSFIVHYQNTTDTKQLKLNVVLTRPTGSCKADMKRWNIGLKDDPWKYINKHYIHVCVTQPNPNLTYHETFNSSRPCLTSYHRVSLYQRDYTILENLFPQVIPFNSKSLFAGALRNLFLQRPEIRKYKENINIELARIFPAIKINYKEEIEFEKLSKLDQLNRMICTVEEKEKPLLSTGTKESSEDEIFDQHVEDIGVCSEGVLQCLNLIITVCCAKPNSIITIDEPDSHVFPNAQKLLIDFFHRKLKEFRLSTFFCQMIITTHSTDIMQAVELKEIRQIFIDPRSYIPTEIKSLSDTTQLLSVMAGLGTSILDHDEIVRLGVHRKLLYLESREDFDFFSGIIRRVKPELLFLPFTIIYKGGRPLPDQIKQLIPGFQHFIPKNSTLSIFILVDPDLRREKKLQDEIKEYTLLNTDKKLKVNVSYHCWPVREWENWLLFNEDLLFDILFGDQLKDVKSIQALREEINKYYPDMQQPFSMLNKLQQDELATTTAVTTINIPQTCDIKDRFLQFFKKELDYHHKMLLNDDLTLSKMEGSDANDSWDSKELAEEGKQYLYEKKLDDEKMKEIFGEILIPILQSIGSQNRKRNQPLKQPKTDEAKEDYLKQCQREWLEKRKIQELPDLDDSETRRTLTQWIDAKKFFYLLTHDRNNKMPKGSKLNLNKYWKEALSIESLGSNCSYSRYFENLDPKDEQKWPKDFTELFEKFEKFVTTP